MNECESDWNTECMAISLNKNRIIKIVVSAEQSSPLSLKQSSKNMSLFHKCGTVNTI